MLDDLGAAVDDLRARERGRGYAWKLRERRTERRRAWSYVLMVVAGIGLPVLLAGYWWELVSRQLLLAGAVAGGVMWWAGAAAVMLGGSRRKDFRKWKR